MAQAEITNLAELQLRVVDRLIFHAGNRTILISVDARQATELHLSAQKAIYGKTV